MSQIKVNFVTNCEKTLENKLVNSGEKIEKPAKLKAKGKFFLGWYSDESFGKKWNFEKDVVSEDVTLYAKWGSKKILGIAFGAIAVIAIVSVCLIFLLSKKPEIEPNTPIEPPVKNEYVVSFSDNVGSIKIVEGGKISIPQEPTKTGFDFVGWFKDEECLIAWDFESDVVTENISLYAKWTDKICTVEFVSNCDKKIDLVSVRYGENVSQPIVENLTKPGSEFGGWCCDEDCSTLFDFENTQITADTKIYAKWIAENYRVNFDIKYTTINDIYCTYDELVEEPVVKKIDGCTFDGWYVDYKYEVKWNFKTDKIRWNTTIYGKWTRQTITLTFDTDNGTEIAPIVALAYDPIIEPEPPTKEGYTFAYWDINFPSVMPGKNTTIKAIWEINLYAVSFETNGGDKIDSSSVEYCNKISKIDDPEKENCIFEGWYIDKELNTKWDFENDVVTKDITLYAKWSKAPSKLASGNSWFKSENFERKDVNLIEFSSNYEATGEEDESWFADDENNGGIVVYAVSNGSGKYKLIISFDGNDIIYANSDSTGLFGEVDGDKFSSLEQIDNINLLDTSNVTTFNSMFKGCSLIESLDLSSFNTLNVTDFSNMFAGCSTLSTLNLSSFNTSNATTLKGMFEGCNLSSIDLSGKNTNKVKNMSGMFKDCKNLVTINLSGINVYFVNDISELFSGCEKLETIFVNSNWQFEKMENSNNMFAGCENLIGELGTCFNSEKTNNEYARLDTKINSGYFTTSGHSPFIKPVTMVSAVDWFNDDIIDKSKIETIEIVKSYNLSSTELENSWNIDSENLGKIKAFVKDNTSEKVLVIAGNGADEIIANNSLCGMFADFSSLKTITGLELLNTKNVTDMSNMFENCSNLTSLTLSKIDTSSVTTMKNMFACCTNLETLNLNIFITMNVENTMEMFANCSKLKTIYVGSNWNLSKVSESSNMFENCAEIVGGNGKTFDELNTDKTYANYTNGYLTYYSYKG